MRHDKADNNIEGVVRRVLRLGERAGRVGFRVQAIGKRLGCKSEGRVQYIVWKLTGAGAAKVFTGYSRRIVAGVVRDLRSGRA